MKLAQLNGTIQSPLKENIKDVSTGLPTLISNLINLAAIIGGLLVLINFIIAGYGFIVASGDPKKITDAWNKIWQSLIGLVIIIAAIIIINLIEAVFGIKIIQPTITGPGTI